MNREPSGDAAEADIEAEEEIFLADDDPDLQRATQAVAAYLMTDGGYCFEDEEEIAIAEADDVAVETDAAALEHDGADREGDVLPPGSCADEEAEFEEEPLEDFFQISEAVALAIGAQLMTDSGYCFDDDIEGPEADDQSDLDAVLGTDVGPLGQDSDGGAERGLSNASQMHSSVTSTALIIWTPVEPLWQAPSAAIPSAELNQFQRSFSPLYLGPLGRALPLASFTGLSWIGRK